MDPHVASNVLKYLHAYYTIVNMPTTMRQLLEAVGSPLVNKPGNSYYQNYLAREFKDNYAAQLNQFDLQEQRRKMQWNIERNMPGWIDVSDTKQSRFKVVRRPRARCTNNFCFKVGYVYHFVGTHLMVCYKCGHNMIDFSAQLVPKYVGPYGYGYAVPRSYAQAKFMQDRDLHLTFF